MIDDIRIMKKPLTGYLLFFGSLVILLSMLFKLDLLILMSGMFIASFVVILNYYFCYNVRLKDVLSSLLKMGMLVTFSLIAFGLFILYIQLNLEENMGLYVAYWFFVYFILSIGLSSLRWKLITEGKGVD